MAIILHDIQPRDTHMAPRSAAHPPGWPQVGRAKAPDPGPAAVRRGNLMDDVNRFARELADAIAAAAADHPKVEACRERARAAGYEMRVSLEAVVGFVSRDKAAATPGKPAAAVRTTPAQAFEVTSNDRRFLRSLRIAADETTEEVDN